jgi:SAM-dependent methyltransferase
MIAVSPDPAAAAFDRLAEEYDAAFTDSNIGRAQRSAVWTCAKEIFKPGSRILELNCGTGEDAVHFAGEGFRITACDVSPGMIARAREKSRQMPGRERLEFHVRSTETIADLLLSKPFEGVFSNFSGLNCVKSLKDLATTLEPMVRPGAPLLLCFSTRYCLWEIAWYLLRADLPRSFRRCSGFHEARLRGVTIPVYYPTCRKIRECFAGGFRLVDIYGIGITVPPSYTERWIAKHPEFLKRLVSVDNRLRRIPVLRVLGDHMLLHFERSHP